ncbi:MAG: alpha/beta hydrolase [Verrucomicrobiae bacterium]|nr:alpha/beta hydrolase [Verrucomicrobiae bacterium]
MSSSPPLMSSGMIAGIVRSVSILLLVVLIALVMVAKRRGNSILEFQLSLVATEFGHWFGVLAIVGAIGFLGSWGNPFIRFGGALAGGIIAFVLFGPLWQAVRLSEGLSIERAFFPGMGPSVEGVVVERCTYGDDELEIVICRPAETELSPASKLPWVVSMHGGGWNGGRPDEFLAWDRELASYGYVVLLPAYRLAPQHQWPAPLDDVRAAVDWGRTHAEELGIDPEELTLFGRSAGGQIAAAAAMGVPELRAKRCVAFYAPHDLFFARKYAKEDDVLDSLKLLRDYLGGDPEENEVAYLSGSAIKQVSAESPPMLMIHGTPDTLVWVEQSRRMAARMSEVGATFEFYELPWAAHACDYFLWTPGGQVMMNKTLEFLAQKR